MKRILLFCLIIFGIILNWTPVYAGEEELNNSLISEVMGGNPEMVQHWVDQGADPNAEVQSGEYAGRSLLYMAARAGHIECVKILLSAGADLNGKDPYYGETPLDVAIRWGHPEIVKILEEAINKQQHESD